jgi:hypothetical protein
MAIGAPKERFCAVWSTAAHRIIVDTYQDSTWASPVGESDSVVQFNEMIVLPNHNGSQGASSQKLSNTFCCVEGHLLLHQKYGGSSAAGTPGVFSAVSSINYNSGKTACA